MLCINKYVITAVGTESEYRITPVQNGQGLIEGEPILCVSINRIKGTAIVVQKNQLSKFHYTGKSNTA